MQIIKSHSKKIAKKPKMGFERSIQKPQEKRSMLSLFDLFERVSCGSVGGPSSEPPAVSAVFGAVQFGWLVWVCFKGGSAFLCSFRIHFFYDTMIQ